MRFLFKVIIFILLSANIYAQTDTNDTLKDAIKKIENKEFAEALKMLKLLENTDNYLVYHNIGFCYYFLEDDESAQTFFRKSIELNANHVESYGYLGMSYFFTDQLDKAEEIFLQCIKLRNNFYKDYYFLAKINEMRNNMYTAIDYYIKALKLNKLDLQSNYSLANIYFDNDDYKNAKKYFEICDKIDSTIYPVVSCLIRIGYRQNNLKDIEKLKQRLRAIRNASNDERLRNLPRFTIDTFTHNNLLIFVEESFNLSGDLYYHWVFRICDNNGDLIKTVNLESSLVLRELGTNYIVGMDQYKDNKRIHETTTIGFKQLPKYSVMKKIVIDEIEKGLEVGVTGVYQDNK